jgi:hypothetical protein
MGDNRPTGFEGAVAEFTALRQEMDRRSTAQQGLLALHITATGALASIVLREPSKILVLLVLPFTSFAFCSLYLDNSLQILRAAKYIADELDSKVPGGLGWESWHGSHQRNKLHDLSWKVPLLVLFPGVATGTWTSPLRQDTSVERRMSG